MCLVNVTSLSFLKMALDDEVSSDADNIKSDCSGLKFDRNFRCCVKSHAKSLRALIAVVLIISHVPGGKTGDI